MVIKLQIFLLIFLMANPYNLATEESKTIIEVNDGTIGETAVPINFKSAENKQSIKITEKKTLGRMIDSIDLEVGKAYIYEKVGDKENLHGGLGKNSDFYDLGPVGDINNSTDGLTKVTSLELYGKTVVKFQGVFGSHVVNTGYFVIEEGTPQPFLLTEGVTTEMDIDRDGVKEIVAELPGTLPAANIFEWDGSSFSVGSVNKALGVESVQFNKEDGSFQGYGRPAVSGNPVGAGYQYTGKELKLKKKEKEIGTILSENLIDYNEDSKYEKVIVKMVKGRQYEEVLPGPFTGWNWQGEFVIRLIAENGKIISEFNLNEAFYNEEMIFNRPFLVQFDDYNNDGNPDFTIGQYGSSSVSLYRLFTIKEDKIEMVPVETGEIAGSGGRSRYTRGFEKYAKRGFINHYYNNVQGKMIKQYFVWDGSRFIVEPAGEEKG